MYCGFIDIYLVTIEVDFWCLADRSTKSNVNQSKKKK